VQTYSHYPAIPAPDFIRRSLRVLPEHPCSYFPDRIARSRAFYAEELTPEQYQELMDAGFRRSGRVVYQPMCGDCRDCISIRVPAATFTPSKSQRRCWRRNQDLIVNIEPATADVEAFDLYTRYLRDWHGDANANGGDRESFESFLYDSPVQTMQMRYRDPNDGRLLAVGICDLCERSLSSVYFFHDPAEHRRGLGTYGAMMEIDLARRLHIAHYYLGFWIRGCAAMEYKSAFRPYQLLHTDGQWRDAESAPTLAKGDGPQ
jgi:arginine-tRNA-protein transferase